MKKFLILLLLLACKEPFNDCNMTISNASEIQFWPTGTESFNIKQLGYTEYRCFHQKFLCASTRRFQGVDTEFDVDKYLFGYDELGAELYSEIYARENIFTTPTDIDFENNEFTSSLTDWGNYSGSPGTEAGWTWDSIGPLGVAKADGTSGTLHQTYELHQQRINLGAGGYDKYPPGDYVFKINLSNESTGGSSPLNEGLYLQATDTLGVFGEAIPSAITIPRGGGFTEYTVPFTTTQPWKYFTIYFYKQGPGSGSVIKIYINSFKIDSSPLDYTVSRYDIEMIPSDETMCGKKVTFKIFDGSDPETDTELFYSDSIDFVQSWENTNHSGKVLMQFKSIQNFAGLIYDVDSPYFNLELDVKNDVIFVPTYKKDEPSWWHKRFGFFLGAGYGYSFDNKQVSPQVGIYFGINLF